MDQHDIAMQIGNFCGSCIFNDTAEAAHLMYLSQFLMVSSTDQREKTDLGDRTSITKSTLNRSHAGLVDAEDVLSSERTTPLNVSETSDSVPSSPKSSGPDSPSEPRPSPQSVQDDLPPRRQNLIQVDSGQQTQSSQQQQQQQQQQTSTIQQTRQKSPLKGQKYKLLQEQDRQQQRSQQQIVVQQHVQQQQQQQQQLLLLQHQQPSPQEQLTREHDQRHELRLLHQQQQQQHQQQQQQHQQQQRQHLYSQYDPSSERTSQRKQKRKRSSNPSIFLRESVKQANTHCSSSSQLLIAGMPTVNPSNGAVSYTLQGYPCALPSLDNVLSTIHVGCRLDLRVIAQLALNADYRPAVFAGLVMRLKEPRATALMFSSGRVVVTGTRTEDLSRLAGRKFARILQRIGFQAKFEEFRVRNVVASCCVGFRLNVEGIFLSHNNVCTFEPDLFPGLIYQMFRPHVILLIFASGKVVLTGTKDWSDICTAFRNIYPVLQAFRLN